MSALLAALLNVMLGGFILNGRDDGRVIRWCRRGGVLQLPCMVLAASLWPACLWILRK